MFSQQKIIKDFNNDSFIDTLIFKEIRLPKNIPTYVEFKDGKTSSNLLIELNNGFNPFSLSESYIINCENFVGDKSLIKSIFSEVYNDEIKKLDIYFEKCQYLGHEFELRDLSNKNEYFESYIRDTCFKYYSVLPELESQFILIGDIKKLQENCFSYDSIGESNPIKKRTERVLWHFWGNKINIDEFTQIKINDTISYYENYGCSFLKKGSFYTWINLTPQRNFWSKHINNTYEPKAILVNNYLFIKKNQLNEENIEIININNGNRNVLIVKDFKDFYIKNTDVLEVTKYHGGSELFVISDLLKGW